MRAIRNPLLFALVLGGIIGYIVACNRAMPTTDANAAPASDENRDAASNVAGDASAEPSADALAADERVQVARATTGSDASTTGENPNIIYDAGMFTPTAGGYNVKCEAVAELTK